MTTQGDNHNLIDVIIADHRAVEQVFTELESGAGTPEHRRDLADHVIAELVRHSVAEEQYMYPAAREALPDGDQIADHELEEHAAAERLMKDVEGLEPTDPQFDMKLRELMADVRHHIEEEEQHLLPMLRTACTPEQLDDLGAKVVQAKKMAPTRPHPAGPDKPPANKILGPGVGLIDKIRDALTGRKH
ncbi:hemerythrin domain-containing protein [Labedaea rhizosphaerae]|uniref:Hemerythrin HHE cation binding domain-containing protein n=1 Tax=Labedaea rhizosphaerae TaxID=598644 RepID=A0A4R6S9Z8_LABRH|nr:hemerythrin domain-containing protein [Labedaea rhizosphaerae]TDP96730.1 hemerythrin HHE cation binding domain-containing protein [Labedaea rhizosphaerae]